MSKYRIVTKMDQGGNIYYAPQVKKFFVWWNLNIYGQIHKFSIYSGRLISEPYIELSVEQAEEAIKIHKQIGEVVNV